MFTAGVRAHLTASRLAAPLMVPRRRGLIVSTTANLRALPYCETCLTLAKNVSHLVWAMAQELREHNVAYRRAGAGFPAPSASSKPSRVPVRPTPWTDRGPKETPFYLGRAIVALAADPRVLDKSGELLEVGALAGVRLHRSRRCAAAAEPPRVSRLTQATCRNTQATGQPGGRPPNDARIVARRDSAISDCPEDAAPSLKTSSAARRRAGLGVRRYQMGAGAAIAPHDQCAAIERALTKGAILRTRAAADVAPGRGRGHRWMLALTGPRVSARMSPPARHLELDARRIPPQSERHRPRAPRRRPAHAAGTEGGSSACRIGRTALASRAHRHAGGNRRGGVQRGAPWHAVNLRCSTSGFHQQPAKSRDDALAEPTRRYFTSHGPAQIADFVWWSGLTTGALAADWLIDPVDQRSASMGRPTGFASCVSATARQDAYLLGLYDGYRSPTRIAAPRSIGPVDAHGARPSRRLCRGTEGHRPAGAGPSKRIEW